jgi:hypothetical protein
VGRKGTPIGGLQQFFVCFVVLKFCGISRVGPYLFLVSLLKIFSSSSEQAPVFVWIFLLPSLA